MTNAYFRWRPDCLRRSSSVLVFYVLGTNAVRVFSFKYFSFHWTYSLSCVDGCTLVGSQLLSPLRELTRIFYIGESFPLRVRPKSIALGSATNWKVYHFDFNLTMSLTRWHRLWNFLLSFFAPRIAARYVWERHVIQKIPLSPTGLDHWS